MTLRVRIVCRNFKVFIDVFRTFINVDEDRSWIYERKKQSLGEMYITSSKVMACALVCFRNLAVLKRLFECCELAKTLGGGLGTAVFH